MRGENEKDNTNAGRHLHERQRSACGKGNLRPRDELD